ncbi:MAG TPA: hypothetical protein VMT03_04445 [Polyangia bacterium]|nr:hypothetical protein [Polyangia bacterium]
MVAFDCVELPGVGVGLGRGWVARVQPTDRGALLRLQSPRQPAVDVEIVLTAAGPVIRAAAAALEITAASDIVARCDQFRVEARGSFSVRAGEVAVTARTGGVAIRANDDVALNGEQVLLNCDRDPPLPSWLPGPAATEER